MISELERPPGEGKGYPLQYCGLEISMDCIVHRVTKSIFLGIYPDKTIIQKYTGTTMFMTVLSIFNSQKWTQSNCPLTDEWIKM